MTRQFKWVIMLTSLLGAALWLAGCATADTTPEAVTPVANPVPQGVMQAREAVLAFLREGANECVPPKQARWTAETETEPPAGYDIYRFESGDCRMTITTARATEEAALYHVALGDGPTGFCWQAVVDANGQVLLTGNAAQTDPTLGNPSKTFCEARGYTYEVITREGGDLCGMCTFDDNRACNAWAYFHGACTPENAVSIEQ